MDKATEAELVNGETREKFDNAKFNDLLCQAAVTGLEDIDDDGQPFGCTPENVLFLAQQSGQFVAAVRGGCTDLERLFTLKKEQEEKK